jgi:hypothetical protein
VKGNINNALQSAQLFIGGGKPGNIAAHALGNSKGAAIIFGIGNPKTGRDALLNGGKRVIRPVQGLKGGHRPKIGIHRIQIHGIFPSLRPVFGTTSISQKEMKKQLNKPLKKQVFYLNSVKILDLT